jgi:hypothetical protein
MNNVEAQILDYYKKVKIANKEATKKEVFKDLLNRLYAKDNDILKIIDKITLGAEQTIFNIPRKDVFHRGSADSLYNKIIIEFENNLKVSGKHAKEQLAGYLLGQFNEGEGYNFTLIASDFITWKVYAIVGMGDFDWSQVFNYVDSIWGSQGVPANEVSSAVLYFYPNSTPYTGPTEGGMMNGAFMWYPTSDSTGHAVNGFYYDANAGYIVYSDDQNNTTGIVSKDSVELVIYPNK